jgi:hypothetical protein
MKNFTNHIKSLSAGKIDYFITDSKFNIFHDQIDNAAILSGSFNPIHYGHKKLLDYCSENFNKNKFYEISISNVDKPNINNKDLITRLEKFQNEEKIIITKSSKFSEKAFLFPNSYFVVGYDTALRILDESYLEINQSLDDLFETIAKKGCKFIVAGRTDVTSPKFDNLNLNHIHDKYRKLFQIIEEKKFRADVSSTEKRRHDN